MSVRARLCLRIGSSAKARLRLVRARMEMLELTRPNLSEGGDVEGVYVNPNGLCFEC